MILATVVSLLGIFLAWLMYGKKSLSRDWLSSKMPLVVSVLQNKYYIDELYEYTVVYVTRAGSLFLQFMEWFLVEGIVKGITGFHSITGKTRSENAKWANSKLWSCCLCWLSTTCCHLRFNRGVY